MHNEKASNIDTFAKRASDPGPAGGSGGEGNVYKGTHEHVEDLEITTSRRLWVIFTWMVTWWIPSPLLQFCGRMGRPDVRMAWREKVAICVIIGFMWAFLLFIIIGLGLIVCPRQYVWTLDDVAGKNTAKSSFVAMRGSVYDITNFMKQKHGDSAYTSTPELMLETYSGQDVNASFPIPVRVACPQFVSAQTDPNYLFFYPVSGASEVDPNQANMFQHTMNRSPLSKELQDPNFYSKYALPTLKKFKKGGIVWKFDWINDMYIEQSMFWRVINKEVFNMQPYFDAAKSGLNVNKKYNLLDARLEKIMDQGGYGTADITKDWDALNWNSTAKLNNYNCMKNMFYVGRVDDRQSVRCLFTNYMLLAFACVLMLVVLVKFLAAMQFGNKKRPVPPIKFVVCQVPCYTEDDESLLKTITSLAALDYQDKHKLIFVICDGNIVGSGNEKSTPRIVLDILGVDPEYDPPGRDYLAIAEGSRRHNIGKVYSGLYEFEGHVVPFMVVVKVGTPDESNRSGNRGKRDSQILLMSFFNKVHFDLPMTPLELEIYHQMRHIIGINPRDFEYLLQVDADTEVMPDSLSRLIAACSSDQRIAGICGETMLGNESKSWTTMMQVYEYFISHHMAKAFESLFGSVTCLPGCFCMYRMRSAEGKPLLIAKPVLEAYSELHVDTLHKKNLLSLGEDRYLTTLMMKHFPQFKYKFIHDAKCKTIAPEKWSVLMSQRRRWINSTIHNLAELMFLQDMCGFCFFSMRFVVFLDLFGTITMPTTLGYFIYLIYIGITGLADVGYISLILIGAIYGVQAIIFIMRREWQHVGWMLIYLCAYPLWSFILPIYSFWHMDDFSWGNTRVVVGDGKRKLIVSDDKPFNPNSILQR
ncbi:family 2 glycosyltransferase, partial [Kickxella alabastrina]|uniref:family 2 glycosyltransferase n=1 Tax=Kickxella alabastrina TaxID=61397 RepID=UPI002220919A